MATKIEMTKAADLQVGDVIFDRLIPVRRTVSSVKVFATTVALTFEDGGRKLCHIGVNFEKVIED